MTHDQYERGERLTIHNATKKQLQWMVKDRDAHIAHQYEEIQKLQEEKRKLLEDFCRYIVEHEKKEAA